MSLNPYLLFPEGKCREAFEHYRSVFGGEFSMLQTFADGPPDMDMPGVEPDHIMHVSLPFGSSVLMGSDHASHMWADFAGNFSISVDAGSRSQADALLAGLAEGGEVEMPMQDMFWGSYFGCCKDRFGVKWMVSFGEATG